MTALAYTLILTNPICALPPLVTIIALLLVSSSISYLVYLAVTREVHEECIIAWLAAAAAAVILLLF